MGKSFDAIFYSEDKKFTIRWIAFCASYARGVALGDLGNHVQLRIFLKFLRSLRDEVQRHVCCIGTSEGDGVVVVDDLNLQPVKFTIHWAHWIALHLKKRG